MKFIAILGQLALGLSAAALLEPGVAAQTSSISATDRHFVMSAAQGGIAEVELGQLAQLKGSSPDVRKFGERMVNDHTKANDQLKQVASSMGITLPTDIDSRDEALKAKLSNLSGSQFDKAYMQNMVEDHTKDVAEFKHESANGHDAAVKNFATQTLPTLESHLQEARKIEPQVRRSLMSSSQ